MDWQHLETLSFGDSPALADELAGLVLAGIKTATCWAAVEGLKTEPGKLTVMLGGNGRPLALIETVELALRRFDEVDASFAYDEGEDDRTLASWREAHRRYFTRLDQFSPDMMLSVSGSALWSGFDPDKQPGEPHNSMAASWSWRMEVAQEALPGAAAQPHARLLCKITRIVSSSGCGAIPRSRNPSRSGDATVSTCMSST
jgi:uncharacterized protein YhfF